MRTIVQATVMAVVILAAFGVGTIFGQYEGIPASITKAATSFQMEEEVPIHTSLAGDFFLMSEMADTVAGEGACPIWRYGQDPPAVGFYYHPQNGRVGVLHVSVPEMRYFLRTFEDCAIVHHGYLE